MKNLKFTFCYMTLFLCFCLYPCSAKTEIIIPEDECALFSERLNKFQDENLPGKIAKKIFKILFTKEVEEHEKRERFDVNGFLKPFDKIRLIDGYVLDYVQENVFSDSYPVVFTRPINADPKVVYKEISNKASYYKQSNFIKHIEFERSPLGYFQFAVFSVVVHQFKLYWHAQYNDAEIILSKNQLDEILKRYGTALLDDGISKLKNIDLKPRIIMKKNSARVRMVAFSKSAGKFFYYNSYIKYPNEIKTGIVHKEVDQPICFLFGNLLAGFKDNIIARYKGGFICY